MSYATKLEILTVALSVVAVAILPSLVNISLLPKSFEEMQRHGLKITSWEERVG
jgi:hypothetical protein